jgi:hypothetical protein
MTAVLYANAHLTITVVNNGTGKLTEVKVADALTPACARDVGTLAAGARITYTCVSDSVKRSFTNIAIVTGEGANGRVSARDHAAVAVKTQTTSSLPARFTG